MPQQHALSRPATGRAWTADARGAHAATAVATHTVSANRDLCDPITGDPLRDPVVAPNGVTYERGSALAELARTEGKLPGYPGRILAEHLMEDFALREALASGDPEDLAELACDPITYDEMAEPVLASDGRTYDRSTLETLVADKGISPFTREPLGTLGYRNLLRGGDASRPGELAVVPLGPERSAVRAARARTLRRQAIGRAYREAREHEQRVERRVRYGCVGSRTGFQLGFVGALIAGAALGGPIGLGVGAAITLVGGPLLGSGVGVAAAVATEPRRRRR